MRRGMITVLAALLATAISAQAQITLSNTASGSTTNKVWTITDLNGTPPTVSTGNGAVSGVLSGVGAFGAGESVTIVTEGFYDYNSAQAQYLLGEGGSITNYLYSTLTKVSVGALAAPVNYEFGVDSTSAATDPQTARIGPNEALTFTVDLSNLTSTNQITLSSIVFGIMNTTKKADILIYDASADAVTVTNWNLGYAGAFVENHVLEHNDIIVIAHNGSSALDFRVRNLTFDIEASVSGVLPPVGFNAVAANSKVTVDWLDDPSGDLKDYYVVQRSLTSNDVDFVVVTNTIDSMYVDTDVTNNVTYYYRAKTVDTNAVETAFSDIVSATPIVPVPTGLAASGGDGEVFLTWNAITDPEFASVNIYRSTVSGVFDGPAIASGWMTNYTDTTVVNETLYYYAISETDLASNESARSAAVFVEPTADLIIVNTMNNEQAEARSYPTGTNEFFNSVGSGQALGQGRIGPYTAFDELARPVMKFRVSEEALGGKTVDDIAKVTLRIYIIENTLREKIDTEYEYLDPTTNVVEGVTNIVYGTTNIVSITTNGPGSIVELYSAQTNSASGAVVGTVDFNHPGFSLVGELDELTSEFPVNSWLGIDVTDVVKSDLINDVTLSNATAGSVFRFQIKDDLLMTTNDHYSARFNDNLPFPRPAAFIPQLRIKWKLGTPYDTWAADFGNIGASTDDFDGDGVNNLYEYGLNGDPTNPAVQGTLPTFTKSGGGFLYIHPMRSDDASLVYTVETTTNLVSGTWTATGYTVGGTNVTGGTLNSVTNTVDTVEDEKFIRLNIAY